MWNTMKKGIVISARKLNTLWIARSSGNPYYFSLMKGFFVFVIALIHTMQISAEETDMIIQGRVIDIQTGLGIPNVTIYTLDGRMCTQSNEDGDYILALECHKITSVVFSSFGYVRDTVACMELKRHPVVKLQPGGLMLKEFSVEAMSPYGLLDEVLKRIPLNYRADTTRNIYFSRYCHMANDSVYLFYENAFESLRTGYGKLDKKRKINYDNDRNRQLGNYNTVLRSRLLIIDSNYLFYLIRSRSRVREMLSYNENNVIADPIEAPNAHIMLAKRKRKQLKMSLIELDDSLGNGHYLLTMKGLGRIFCLVVNPNDYAITSITIDQDTGTTIFPTKKTYRERHALAKQICHQRHTEYKYEKINGKYTLVSYKYHNIYTDVCHNEYRWRDAPTVQKFQCSGLVQLIEQTPVDYSQENVLFPELQKKVSLDQVATKHTQYDADFWQGISFPAIPRSMEQVVNATLQRLETP